MSKLTQKSFLNFFASILKTFGILLLTFITTPLILKLIGAENFGTYKVLTEIHSYVSLIEMGLLASIVAGMLPLLKPEKRDQLMSFMAQGSWTYKKITIWTFLIGIASLPFLERLTSWSEGSPFKLYFTFLFLLATALFLPSNVYRAYLDSSNQGHLVHFTNFIQSVLLTLLAVFFAYLGWGIISQSVAYFIAVGIGALLLRFFSDIKVNLKLRNDHSKLQIFRNRKPQVLNELAGKFCLHIDQIVIASFLGPLLVTKVFIGQRVVQILQQQLLSLGQASWASLSTLYYQDKNDSNIFEKRMIEMTKTIAVFAISGLVPICILNQNFITLWVGKSYLLESNSLVYISALNAFFLGLFSFWGHVFAVLGKSYVITKVFWIQAIINVIASLLATIYLGGIGPVTGTLISYVLIPIWAYPNLLNKHLALNQMKVLKSFLWPLSIGISVIIIFHYSAWSLTNLNWPELICYGLIIFLLHASFLFILFFTKDERKLFLNRIHALKINHNK